MLQLQVRSMISVLVGTCWKARYRYFLPPWGSNNASTHAHKYPILWLETTQGIWLPEPNSTRHQYKVLKLPLSREIRDEWDPYLEWICTYAVFPRLAKSLHERVYFQGEGMNSFWMGISGLGGVESHWIP